MKKIHAILIVLSLSLVAFVSGSRLFTISDLAGDVALVTSTGALHVSDVSSQQIYDGRIYISTHIEDSVANGASHDHLIRVGTFVPIVNVTSSAGGDAELYIFESPSISATGTIISSYNKNRNYSDTPTMDVYEDPTVTDTGTQLSEIFVPGGTGANSVGGTGTLQGEIILEANTDYLIRATNTAASAQDISITTLWYEAQ